MSSDTTAGLNLLQIAKRIQLLADTGLLYAQDAYDRERYTELRDIYLRLMETVSQHPVETLRASFPLPDEYPTVKVDVRAVVLNDEGKILFTREKTDGCYALPGGWADAGFSPAETAVKETFEETGIQVEAVRLLGVMDKRLHPHPAEAFYVYKIFIQCRVLGGSLQAGHDVLGADWFDIDQLPELSTPRNTAEQIQTMVRIIQDNQPAWLE